MKAVLDPNVVISALLSRTGAPAAVFRAWLEGEYGMSGLFLGVPCKLGRKGLEAVLEVELTPAERVALGKSADAVREPMAKLA